MHPYLNIAVKAARSAAKFLMDSILHLNLSDVRNNYQKNSSLINSDFLNNNNNNNIICNIIQKVENTLVNYIVRSYSQHNIYSVNGLSRKNNSDVTWIIQPLTGELNFIYGIPFFAISIAICKAGIIEHGLIYNPVLDELFIASKGNGAQLNNKKIRVSTNKKMPNLLIASSNGNADFNKLNLDKCNVLHRNLGSEALHLAFVAADRLDGYCGLKVSSLEVAAGILLVKEAGGYVTDVNFVDLTLDYISIIASNPKIYSELSECL